MICTLILTTGLIAIAAMLAFTVQQQIGAREAARSMRLAQAKIDELMKADFATSPALAICANINTCLTTNSPTTSRPLPMASLVSPCDGRWRPGRRLTRGSCRFAWSICGRNNNANRTWPPSSGTGNEGDDAIRPACHARSGRQRRSSGEGGFTLIEFIIAMAITSAVLGATVGLAASIQQAYTSDLDNVAVEQEVRYALDWVSRYLRSAGSNPYSCAVFQPIWIDPNGNGDDDDVRVQADINPPDGTCTDSEEDVTIALDGARNVITLDTGAGAVDMTDPIISNLVFTYLDDARNPTTAEAQITYVGIAITGQSEGRSTTTGFTEFTLSTEVRIRTR